MIIRVYDRGTAARMLRQWRAVGSAVRLISRGVAWCGRLGRDPHVLTLVTGVPTRGSKPSKTVSSWT